MFKYFNVFKSVYETLNFSQSAKELFISQSTVSQQIKQLEENLQVQLFIRNGKRNINPTQAADQLYQQGLKIWDNMNALKQNITKMNSDYIECKIGVSNTIAETKMAQLFKLITVPQNIHLTLEMSNSTDIANKISQRKYTFGFIEKPITTPGLVRVPFFQDQLVHAGNPKSKIWLQRETGSGVRHYTEEYLKLNNIIPKQIYTLESNEMILKFLQNGIGQTITSKSVLPDNVIYQKLSTNFNRDFFFLTRPSYQTAGLINLKQQLLTAIKKIN